MSRYDKLHIRVDIAKSFIDISDSKRISLNNTLKTYNKVNQSNLLYYEGINWFKSGKKIEEATETINYLGNFMQKKDQRNFIQGFKEGIRLRAYEVGREGYLKDDLPLDCVPYVDEDIFIQSYNEGIGFKFGYDGVTVDELPLELVQEKNFLQGYSKGIKTKASENNKNRR